MGGSVRLAGWLGGGCIGCLRGETWETIMMSACAARSSAVSPLCLLAPLLKFDVCLESGDVWRRKLVTGAASWWGRCVVHSLIGGDKMCCKTKLSSLTEEERRVGWDGPTLEGLP